MIPRGSAPGRAGMASADHQSRPERLYAWQGAGQLTSSFGQSIVRHDSAPTLGQLQQLIDQSPWMRPSAQSPGRGVDYRGPVRDRNRGAVLVADEVDAGIELLGERLDYAGTQAGRSVGRAFTRLANAVVGNRKRPVRPAGVIGDNNPAVRAPTGAAHERRVPSRPPPRVSCWSRSCRPTARWPAGRRPPCPGPVSPGRWPGGPTPGPGRQRCGWPTRPVCSPT